MSSFCHEFMSFAHEISLFPMRKIHGKICPGESLHPGRGRPEKARGDCRLEDSGHVENEDFNGKIWDFMCDFTRIRMWLSYA